MREKQLCRQARAKSEHDSAAEPEQQARDGLNALLRGQTRPEPIEKQDLQPMATERWPQHERDKNRPASDPAEPRRGDRRGQERDADRSRECDAERFAETLLVSHLFSPRLEPSRHSRVWRR